MGTLLAGLRPFFALLLVVPIAGLFAAAGCADRDRSQHVEFARRSEGPLLGQAVYPPSRGSRKAPPPCAVLLHGGSWRSGERTHMGQVARRLSEHGIVAFSVDYRLTPTHRWPAPYEDAAEAVAWVRKNHRTLGIDPQRVVAVGISAGGHLALSLSARGVAPAGSIFGPTDLAPGRMPTLEDAVTALVGSDPVVVRDASPVRLVGPRSAPAFLVQGDRDGTVPPSHATSFAAAMRAAGRPVELRMLKGQDHRFDDRSFDVWAAVDRMAEWIVALES